MLSITDIKDFIDLDRETVFIVTGATGLSPEESTLLARQLLASEQGLTILHHMFLYKARLLPGWALIPE